MAEERLFGFEGISTKTSKTEKQREKTLGEKKHNIQELWDYYRKYNSHLGAPEGEERERNRKYERDFPQINIGHQTIRSGISENTEQDKCQTKQNKTIPKHLIFKQQKIKDEEKVLKEARGKTSYP